MGVQLNRQQFADLLGKSPKWIGELIKKGLPVESGGGRGTQLVIDSEKAITWLIDYEVNRQVGAALDANMPQQGTIEGEELLLTMAKRRKAWVEADKAEKTVINNEDVAQFFYGVSTVFSSELDGYGPRLSSELAVINDPATIRHMLFTESRRVRAATADRLTQFVDEYCQKRDTDNNSETAEECSGMGD